MCADTAGGRKRLKHARRRRDEPILKAAMHATIAGSVAPALVASTRTMRTTAIVLHTFAREPADR